MVKHLESNNFSEEIKDKKIVVDFYADWCGPCKMLAPVLEEVKDIDVLKVNTDNYPDIASNYGIMSIPTLILFDNGQEINRILGYHTLDEINEFVK